MSHIRPADIEQAAAAAIDAAKAAGTLADELPAHYDRHGDLLLVRGDQQLYIDVSVTRPTRVSAPASAKRESLVSATAVQGFKLQKYGAIARANNYQLLPFVLETYGGLAKLAHRTLDLISAHAPDPRSFRRHAYRSIAVCLQRGNTQVALLGQQQLHLRRQRISVLHEHTRFTHHAYAWRQLQSTDDLAYEVEPSLAAAAASAAAAHAAGTCHHAYVHTAITVPPMVDAAACAQLRSAAAA